MRVQLTNLSATDTLYVPPPFDVTLAAAATKDLDVHLRDIQEYRQNPARVDHLREIEQMLKSARLTITVVSRDPADWDLEELLIAGSGAAYKRRGEFTPAAAAASHTIPLGGDALPAATYRVMVSLSDSGAAPVACEVRNRTTTQFEVHFGAGWGNPGSIHWEVEYPA